MLASSKMTIEMDKELILIMMKVNTQGNLYQVNIMEKELLHLVMEV